LKPVHKVANQAPVKGIPEFSGNTTFTSTSIAIGLGPKVVISLHIHVFIGRHVAQGELRVINQHGTGHQDVHGKINAQPQREEAQILSLSTGINTQENRVVDQIPRQRHQKHKEPLVVVQSNGIAHKGTIVIKQQDASPGTAVMFGPGGSGNVTRVAELRLDFFGFGIRRVGITRQRFAVQLSPVTNFRARIVQSSRIGGLRLVEGKNNGHGQKGLHNVKDGTIPHDALTQIEEGNVHRVGEPNIGQNLGLDIVIGEGGCHIHGIVDTGGNPHPLSPLMSIAQPIDQQGLDQQFGILLIAGNHTPGTTARRDPRKSSLRLLQHGRRVRFLLVHGQIVRGPTIFIFQGQQVHDILGVLIPRSGNVTHNVLTRTRMTPQRGQVQRRLSVRIGSLQHREGARVGLLFFVIRQEAEDRRRTLVGGPMRGGIAAIVQIIQSSVVLMNQVGYRFDVTVLGGEQEGSATGRVAGVQQLLGGSTSRCRGSSIDWITLLAATATGRGGQ